MGYPAHARSHNAWAHDWHLLAPTATWTVAPPLEPLSDSEEEEESEADEPAALEAKLSHLRAPAAGLATSSRLNE